MKFVFALFLFFVNSVEAASPVVSEYHSLQNQWLARCEGRIYPECKNQDPILAEAMQRANRTQRSLLILVGFDECDGCQATERVLKDRDFEEQLENLLNEYVIVHLHFRFLSSIPNQYGIKAKAAPTALVATIQRGSLMVRGTFYPSLLAQDGSLMYDTVYSLHSKANQILKSNAH